MKQPAIQIPEGCKEVLLHACCAPCSSAIVEWLLAHGVRPTIFYFNPNIWPREEYNIRKEESKRHAMSLDIQWIDGDYDHEMWQQGICGLEEEPERGRRCEQCFLLRLTVTARKAQELGIPFFATTLASSRWKDLEQINRAGLTAAHIVNGETDHQVHFWPQNWRKDGLQERRNQLLRMYGFYNQQYCGCEYSARQALTKPLLRQQMRDTKIQHQEQLPVLSEEVVQRLMERLDSVVKGREGISSLTILAYWPLPDEVDIRPFIHQLLQQGHSVLLPKVVDATTMELRRYVSSDDMVEGSFHIMEPSGPLFTDYASIDIALIPGMAFDAAGHRLGRGKGYYDRFLSTLLSADKRSLLTIGVCFPFQRVAEVPVDSHDISVAEVI